MNKTAFILSVTALGFACNAMAGEARSAVSSKNPKGPIQIEVPSLCDAFNPGPVVSLYGAGIVAGDDLDDALGGGLSLGYFFTENVGIEVAGTWLATESVMHDITGSVVFRAPIKSACIAPYVLVGGGIETDSVVQGTAHVGAGLDVRFSGRAGIFADARYTFADETENYTIIRAGFRISL